MKQIRSGKSFRITTCRACNSSKLRLWLSFGDQPPANSLLNKPSDYQDKFPLDVCICNSCGLVQLRDVVNPKILFGNYVYYSSTTTSFVEHFEKLAKDVFRDYSLKENDLVIDIGSNDGILLAPFKKLGTQVIGIEPAKHIAKISRAKGIPTIDKFFDLSVVIDILKETGKFAKVITATNVFAHIYDLDRVIEGVKKLLDTDGIFVIENPYLWQMIKQGTFDLIYHEHLFYYDITGMSALLKQNGMKIIDFQKISTHGGSIRYFVSPNLNKLQSNKIRQALHQESIWRKSDKFSRFAKKLSKNKASLISFLENQRLKNKTVVGYGAPAKASTILNYYQLDQRFIKFIVDDSPAKHYKFLPGVKIPILQTNELFKENPDFVLILAWNFAKPISHHLRESGYKGRIITPFT